MNVFADNITIEDDMSVLVKYASGATMTYHLTAYSVSDPLIRTFTSYPNRMLSDTPLVARDSMAEHNHQSRADSSHGKATGSCSTVTKVVSSLKLSNHHIVRSPSRVVMPLEQHTERRLCRMRDLRKSLCNSYGRPRRMCHSLWRREVTVSVECLLRYPGVLEPYHDLLSTSASRTL
jgi:hypothetical protein